MEVRADITADDYRAFQRHAARRPSSSRTRFPFAILVVAWLAVVMLFTWSYTATTLRPGYIFAFGLGALAGMAVIYLAMRRWRARVGSLESRSHLGERTIAVEDGGLRVHAAAFELFLRRDAVQAVEETADHIFVYADRGAPIIVPKRAFASTDERTAWLDQLRRVA